MASRVVFLLNDYIFFYYLSLKLQSRGSLREQQRDMCQQLHKRQHYKKPIVRVKGPSHSALTVFLWAKMGHGVKH